MALDLSRIPVINIDTIKSIRTLEATAREVFSRIDLRAPFRGWRPRFEYIPNGFLDEDALRITIITPDRTTGLPIELHFQRPVGQLRDAPPDTWEHFLLELVHRTLQELVLHELDEAFHFDGRRIYDPHKNGR